MTEQTSIISKEPATFNTYIINTNARQLAINPVTTNPFFVDYGWTPLQSSAYKTDWRDKWVNDIYPKYIDPLQSTGNQKLLTHQFINDFDIWVHEEKLLDKIKASDVFTQTESTIWNIDFERDIPTPLSAPITAQIFASVAGRGMGKFDIRVRETQDSSRASVAREAGANCVQFAWGVIDEPENAITDPNDKLLQKATSTKAHFEFDAGSENQARWLVIYFRWFNTSYPQYAGGWSTLHLQVIG